MGGVPRAAGLLALRNRTSTFMQLGVSFFFVFLVFLIDLALQADQGVSIPSLIFPPTPSPPCILPPHSAHPSSLSPRPRPEPPRREP